MKPRFNGFKTAPGAYKAMLGLEQYLHQSGLEESLLHLIKLRASQLNGCAYCIDMHWKDPWRECPFYTDRERAALAWTEAVTLITDGHVPDAVYDEVRPHFSEKEIADLTFAIATINAWNRLSIASRAVPGTYEPPRKREPQISA